MKKLVLPILGVWMSLAAPASAADWYHWRGPWQNGVSPERDLPAKWSADPKDADSNLVWKVAHGSRSTPLVMNGRVFLINYTGEKETIQERVMCLDADTGKLVWEHKFNVFHTTIVTSRLGWTNLAGDPKTGNIYAHGTQGYLNCYNRDGKLLWSRQLTEEYGRVSGYGGRVTSPAVVDDLVVIGNINSSWGDQGKGGDRWCAFNKYNGEVVWWSQPGGQPKSTYYSVPVVAVIGGEKLIISGGASGGVHAMQAATGKPVWNYYFGTKDINVAPVVEGNLIYIGHGEESPDTNVKGRIVCLDGSQVKDGEPKLVWKKDGIKARYASFILHDGRLYVPDEVGRLYCLDAKTGKQQWKYTFGRSGRGSPILADGKIYINEVQSRFFILKPEKDSCELLDEHFFPSSDGVSDVELNGSPAAANGRVYFTTSDETYCIGKKGAKSAEVVETTPVLKKGAKPAWLQVLPADVVVHAAQSAKFKARAFDEYGNFLKEVEAEWSLPTPKPPPGAKTSPPPLKGKVASGTATVCELTVDKMPPAQQGYVEAKFEGLTGRARVRVAPSIPYAQDFEKVPEGAVPAGWVNTQGKFVVKTLKTGDKVLAKVNTNPSPLVARGNAYVTLPEATNYTIECDLMGTKQGNDLPDIGIIANRYTLWLAGNHQKLRLTSWDVIPRIDNTASYPWKPEVWYRAKLTVDYQDGKAIAKGKVWQRDEPEPKDWTLTVEDPRPNREGSAGLYGYVLGILENNGVGNECYYDNLKITPNKK